MQDKHTYLMINGKRVANLYGIFCQMDISIPKTGKSEDARVTTNREEVAKLMSNKPGLFMWESSKVYKFCEVILDSHVNAIDVCCFTSTHIDKIDVKQVSEIRWHNGILGTCSCMHYQLRIKAYRIVLDENSNKFLHDIEQHFSHLPHVCAFLTQAKNENKQKWWVLITDHVWKTVKQMN